MFIVSILGISVLVIFFLFILARKEKKKSDKWLLLCLFLFACILFTFMWAESGYSILKYIFQILVNIYFFPTLLIYGLTLIDENQKFKKSLWWIPSFAIVFTFFLIIDFGFINDYSNPNTLKSLYESPPPFYQFFYKSQYIYVILSLLWFIKKVNQYSVKIKSNFSCIEHIELKWLKKFAVIYIVIHVLSFIFILAADFKLIEDIKIPFGILFIGVIGSLYYLSYHGMRHYAVADFKYLDNYNHSFNEKNISQNNEKSKNKYESSSLSKKEINDLFEEIKSLFENDQIYLEPQLKINVLAKKLNVTTHKVSQVINTKTDKPFYDFVNHYRVEYFKKLLINPENRKFTILAMGIESGFNSKASLNRIFKEYVGQSPKQYQKAHF